jgi:FkbM family methyltransferase
MHKVEKFCIGLRHSPLVRRFDWLWNGVRPVYNSAVARFASGGLNRLINGTDQMLVLPELRGVSERYEPEVWPRIMSEVRRGDLVVDVGAFVGLYAVAFGKRVGGEGRVVAFEPDPANFETLQRQIVLNGLDGLVESRPAAVGNRDGLIQFASGRSSESHMTTNGGEGRPVPVCRLDSVFPSAKIDIIKIDVEGFEEQVLQGAAVLLADEARKPRALFIEVHPYNWHLCGTTSDSLINLLRMHRYEVLNLNNRVLSKIDSYGEIAAVNRIARY